MAIFSLVFAVADQRCNDASFHELRKRFVRVTFKKQYPMLCSRSLLLWGTQNISFSGVQQLQVTKHVEIDYACALACVQPTNSVGQIPGRLSPVPTSPCSIPGGSYAQSQVVHFQFQSVLTQMDA